MPPLPPIRPATRELADSAYAHTSAVLGHTRDAVDAAIIAVRKGGRSKAAVLGHARDAALARADSATTGPAEVADDLEDLARDLAFTRPPLERAIVDLDARHHLDQAELAHALGMSPTAATARVGEVGGTWQQELDPALLAYLGPSGCDDLAALLDRAGPPNADDDAAAAVEDTRKTLADLLEEGRIVAAHVETCAGCRDRLRAMVSVRTLLSRAPLDDAPDEVQEAAELSRARATGAPKSLAERPRTRSRRWPVAVAATLAVVVVAIAAVVIVAQQDPTDDTRVEALTKTPAGGTGLRVMPPVVDALESPRVQLSNLLDRNTAWEATADPGLITQPASGDLASSASDDVVIAVTGEAPEGDFAGTVTFTGDDGSTATVRVQSTIRRPPDVAAQRQGCEITATVQDESEIGDVLLHFRDADGDHTRRMQLVEGETSWRGALPPGGPLAWSVSAVDALGNEGHTAEAPLEPGAC